MVEIRPFDLQNVALHYKWKNNGDLDDYDSQYAHQTESFESFLTRVKSVLNNKNSTAQLFEIHCSQSKKMIGMVDIYAIDKNHKRCFINCAIGNPEYLERGCEIKALGIMLGYCFNELGMHKVYTTAFNFNISWIKGLKELGFRKEKELRDRAPNHEKFSGEIAFGLLAEEYEKVVKISKMGAVN